MVNFFPKKSTEFAPFKTLDQVDMTKDASPKSPLYREIASFRGNRPKRDAGLH